MASNKERDVMIARLKKQRGDCKRSLTLLEKKLSSTSITESLAHTLTTEVMGLQLKFSSIYHELQELYEGDSAALLNEEKEADKFGEKCLDLKLALGVHMAPPTRASSPALGSDNTIQLVLSNQTDIMRQMMEFQRSSSSMSAADGGNQGGSARTKLPQLSLPTFDGQYTDWLRFRDAFESAIHNNSDLQPNQKMQYLKMALTGSAAEYVSHVSISNANYEPTWDRLKNKYEKKVHLVNSFIDQFMAQSKQRVESVTDLQRASRKYRQIFDSMTALGEDCLTLDVWLIYLMKQNMSERFRTEWERERDSKKMANIEEFFDFMEKQTDVMERATSGLSNPVQHSAENKGYAKPSDKSFPKVAKGGIKSHLLELPKCVQCGESHPIYQCERFKAQAAEERRRVINKSSLCFNCLRSNHSSKKCPSQSRCRVCGKSHHTLIHLETQPAQSVRKDDTHQRPSQTPGQTTANQQTESPPAPLTDDPGSISSTVTSHHSSVSHRALLPTALVHIKDVRGVDQVCRILIDGGGECTMISEECAQRLGLPRRNSRVPVTGAGGVTLGYTRGLVQLDMSSTHNQGNRIEASAYVMQKVTSLLPPVPLTEKKWLHVTSLQLADPGYKIPGKIDVILGAEHSHEINLPHILKGNDGEPIAQLTIFGWIIAGKVSGEPPRLTSFHTQCNLDEILTRFWETENVPEKKKKCYTEEERRCEEHFARTHTRDESGRYVVKLAFKEDHEELGNSYSAAACRLQAMERRFQRNPEFQAEYKKFMDEYINLGHMEEVPPGELQKPDSQQYILPHQAVLRPSSETTKLRVVFDASAATRPHDQSLNSVLAVGPVLQDDLLVLLLRFRSYETAFSADVEKMYRQITVAPEDRDFQRILWRSSSTQRVKTFRLNTVTYGTSSAPYLATRVLQQMAYDNSDEFPEASNAILNSFYMDDLLCGASDLQEARKLRQDIQEVLKRGKFSLRKWSSNAQGLLQEIPPEMRALSPEEVEGQSKSISALGLKWSPGKDVFSLIIETLPKVNTKREFCAASAKIFDPLGLIAPVTVKLKIMLQSLWLTGIDWDTPLPEEITETCQRLLSDFGRLKEVSVNRCLPSADGIIELHGFADASEQAYGAVVYAKGRDSRGNSLISIVMAKSRVAPLKTVTIPRLELSGCLLLAELLDRVKGAIINKEVKMYAWTDSMVALQWIQSSPKKWNKYVANRASDIQEIVPPSVWRHVRTAHNPADCVSRGISPAELMEHHLWWHGPPWLMEDEEKWPLSPAKKSITNEEKPSAVQVFVNVVKASEVLEELISQSSCFAKSVRILALILRFRHNCSVRECERQKDFLSVSEKTRALEIICAHIQRKRFPDEYQCCERGKEVSKASKLHKLVPFMGENGVLRVKGRLENAVMTYAARHPIILPSDHKFVRDLVARTHEVYLHAGATHVQGILRAKFWIIGERCLVKDVIRKCVKCSRNRPRMETPMMGDLPAVRVQQCRPFYNTGCDFAGPFNFKSSYLRKSVVTKGYICLFICMATKAVHLEAVTDLSTEKFKAALRRFTARRGQCGTIFCDNATNFVGVTGATREDRLKSVRDHRGKVIRFMSDVGTEFHYIPSYSPTFGGLWERGVGSTKTHLRKVVGDTALTYEEFSTVLAQIEACINSRPLCAMSTEVDDLQALTPAHFLVGHELTLPPGPDLMDKNPNLLSKWHLLQSFVQHFWRRWHHEYISTLQCRPKWASSSRNLEIGDLVLVREPNLKPSLWKMGRITATHAGKDDVVRVVTVKTQDSIQKRAANTLARIPMEEKSQSVEFLNPGNLCEGNGV